MIIDWDIKEIKSEVETPPHERVPSARDDVERFAPVPELTSLGGDSAKDAMMACLGLPGRTQ